MPIQTDLNVSPYFDDYSDNSDYYKILFRPSVAVQVRELNQLQTILQKQIERFGDNVYKRGTIIDGCNFIFYDSLPYVKINDIEVTGSPVNASQYKGLFAKNSANLVSRVVEAIEGFESTAPDLNTLYLSYLNGGVTGEETQYSPNQILTIYDADNSIRKVNIIDGSAGFSNTDSVVFLSAIEVQNTTGGNTFAINFQVGETITQQTTNAHATIIAIDTTSNNEAVILKIKPLATDLNTANTAAWSFVTDYTVTGGTTTATAVVKRNIGAGATASLVTDGTGRVINISMIQKGSGYYVEPQVSINSIGNISSRIGITNFTAQNYLTQVTVNSSTDAVGNGYGFGVSEGIIYQKGYFSRVSDNFVVVEKYSTSTNNVVGFDTLEEIITSDIDTTLLDNSSNTFNTQAPGANRLKLTPTLVVLTKEEAEANTNFFSIVEFSEGNPFKQNQVTQFNSINKEIAKRTFEESGNYVIDQFLIKTQGTDNFEDEASSFELAIDPGLAYIDGYRVQTYNNFYTALDKGTDTAITNTQISVSYGNYIKVNELGGVFKFNVGDLISFRDTAAQYITVNHGSAIAAAGEEIGTARIRSILHVSGQAGTPNAEYWLYLFDVRMNIGKNLSDIRSVYYNGTNKGIGDTILDEGVTKIYGIAEDSLIFYSGNKSLKNANNITYTYRTINETLSSNTQGKITISLASNPGEYFAYNTTLSEIQKQDLIVTPLANGFSTSNIGGSLSTFANTTVTGTGTEFTSVFQPGDYIVVANVTNSEVRRISAIANATHLTVANDFTLSFTSANAAVAFPQFVPVPLALKTNRTATVDSNTTLIIDAGIVSSLGSVTTPLNVAVAYSAIRTVNAVSKSVTRQAFVKIDTTTNADGVNGPWCLGLPDIVRLRNVYAGVGSVTTTSPNITSAFYIDHNQKKNYYDVGFLYKDKGYTLTAGTILLVEFDVLTTSEQGLKTIASYPLNDTLTFANSASTINTLEIPEMYSDKGEYFDLRDYFDFRPYVANTAIITQVAASAPTNPIEPTNTTRFDNTVDKKFPAPQSDCSATLERYLGRIDAIMLTSNNDFKVIRGRATDKPEVPSIPNEGLFLNYITISPYPSIPQIASNETNNFLNKRIANIKFINKRQQDYRVTVPIDEKLTAKRQPRRYTMADIGQLERRISDLEYYTSLTFTEDTVNSLVIPSSIDPTINRFKFGFFVDNFVTANFADINDPEYNAQIFSYQLQPKKNHFNIRYKFNENDANTAANISGKKLLLPQENFTLVKQGYATEPTSVDVAITKTVTTKTGEITTVTETVNKKITKQQLFELISTQKKQVGSTTQSVQQSTTIYETQKREVTGTDSKDFSASGYNTNYAYYQFGEQAGTVTITMTNTGGRSSATTDIWIFQRIASHTVSGTGQTNNLQAFGSSTIANKGYTVIGTFGAKSPGSYSKSFTYNPALGRNILIVGIRGKYQPGLRYTISYPKTEIQTVPKQSVSFVDTQVPVYADVATTIGTSTEDITTTTVVEVLPKTIENLATTQQISSIFSSKYCGFMDTEQLFVQQSNINSPYVDLVKFIANDLNK